MKISKTNFIVILILLFSFFTRIYRLDTNPAGFFCDEALIGVEAQSLLRSGRDTHGEFLPIFFKGFNNDNMDPFAIYFAIPFVSVFGLNESSVRLSTVFFSTIEILIFFLLLKELLPVKLTLLGTFLLSVSPWHFHISRIIMDAYYSWTLFTLISYLFLIKAIKTKKFAYFILTGIFFGITSYGYTPARLTTPLLFVLCLPLLLTTKEYKKTLATIIIFLIILIPFLKFHLTNPNSFARMKATTSPKLNKGLFLQKYSLHFSDEFLYQKGDADFPGQFIKRHSISGLGLLYPYQKWLIIAGLIWLAVEVIKKKKSELIFTLFLLFLFPLADSLTLDKTPFATRSYLGVLPFHILIAFGLYAFYQLLQKYQLWTKAVVRKPLMILFLFLIVNSVDLLLVKHSQNPLYTSDFWGFQYGPREIIGYFKQIEKNYDQLYMEPVFNAPQIFFKFYAPDSCKNCFWGNLENFDSTKKQLFALSSGYLQQNPNLVYITKKIIYYPNGNEAFRIIEVKKF